MAKLQPLVQLAAREIAEQDPDVYTVGLTLRRGQPVLRAVRRATLRAQATKLPRRSQGLPLLVEEALHPLVPLYKIPGAQAQAARSPSRSSSARYASASRCRTSPTTSATAAWATATAPWAPWAALFAGAARCRC